MGRGDGGRGRGESHFRSRKSVARSRKSWKGMAWLHDQDNVRLMMKEAHDLMSAPHRGLCMGLQTYQLLNCDDHVNFLKRNKKDPAAYRPDITHQVSHGTVSC